MLSKDKVWEMFQKIYFDSIDKGDMAKAASVFHEDVEWIHTQVWEHNEYHRNKGSDKLIGRDKVQALLEGRRSALAKQNIRHVIQDLVLEGNKGAFLGHVKGHGKELALMAWFELENEKICRYIITPL